MPATTLFEPLEGSLLQALGRGLSDGWLLDAVIAVLLLEAVGLLVWHRRGGGPAPGRWWPMLAAGGGLLLAWRLAQAGAAVPWALLALAAAGGAHALDLWRRCRAWTGPSVAATPAVAPGAAAGRSAPAGPVKAPARRSG